MSMRLTKEEIKKCLTEDWSYFTNEYWEGGFANEEGIRQTIYLLHQKKDPYPITLNKTVTRNNKSPHFKLHVNVEEISEESIIEVNKIGKNLLEAFMEKDLNKIRDTVGKEITITYSGYALDLTIYEQPVSEDEIMAWQDEIEDMIERNLDDSENNSSGENFFRVIGDKGRTIIRLLGDEQGFIEYQEEGPNVWKVSLKLKLFSKLEKRNKVNSGLKSWLSNKGITTF